MASTFQLALHAEVLARYAMSSTLARHASAIVAACSLVLPVTVEAAPPKRTPPDYDGRGAERTTPGRAMLWVPRVVLFPLYVTSEYVIRRPLGAAIAGAERAHLPDTLYSIFMLSEDRKVGWVPTFLVDFGFKPSVGLYFFWNDAFATGNDLRLQVATWGATWLAGSVTDRIHLSRRDSLTLRLAGIRRPDYRYYGEGPGSIEANLSRYSADRIEANGTYALDLGGSSRLEGGVGYRRLRFRDPDVGGYVPTSARAAQGAFGLPNAYGIGYTAGVSRLLLRLDSRSARPRGQSGVRLDLDAEQGSAPQAIPLGWVRYGAIVGGFVDLNDRARVLGLSVAAQFSDPLTGAAVPFTELVQLGGSEPMRGFLPGRLMGRSALVTTLSYHWPVWVWLDGTIQAAVGNVFGPHFNDFDPSLLRFSGAVGVATAGFSDNPVELLVGIGTETFERGAQLNSIRFAFGTSRGF
jgi:hypothetical protein